MRIFYSLLTYVLTPVLLAYFVARGIRDRGWWKRWSERFGEFDATGRMQGIVVHAASVGEVNAAAPLIQSLQERWPDYPLTITCFTPTGSRRIRSLFGSSVHHVYAPIDLPGAVRRFLNHLEPRLLIIMETEIWPNLFRHAHLLQPDCCSD
jgi:3-deoxy-D-manno-octulosonic-acid transferase